MPDAMPQADAAGGAVAALARGDFTAALIDLRAAAASAAPSRETLLNLAIAEDHAGDPARAAALRAAIAARWPDWPEVVVRQAEALRRAGDFAGAQAEYRRVLTLDPTRPEALLSLAVMQAQQGDMPASLRDLRAVCATLPENAEAWEALGVTCLLAREPTEAEAALARAQALRPTHLDIACKRAEAAILAERAAEALQAMEAPSRADPSNVALLTARALLLRALGEPEAAVELLEAADALAPATLAVLRPFADLLINLNRVREAEAVLSQALALAPEDAGLANNHAAVLIRLQRHLPACEELQRLVGRHGAAVGVLSNLANAQVSLGLQEESLRTARRALECAPGSHYAARALANTLAYHPDVTGAGLLAAHRRAGELLDRSAVLPPAPPRAGGRLRVGLLSALLKTHPVGWLTVAGFEALDPAEFELVCLGARPTEDSIQRRFAAIAAEWHVVAGRTPAQVAAAIRAAGVDVLIDMGGYGDLGMMAACAYRPAPVQVKWVGSQAHSSGLAEMDWFITDRWETPEGFDHLYSERLWRMPDGYVCYSPPAYAPDVAPAPALRQGAVTFGCFNNLAKVTPQVLDSWAAILRACPGARLLLKCHQLNAEETRARVAGAFAARGIAPARLLLRGSSLHRALLAEYAEVDIVLDPFPYTGGLTTCEALWMGVPTVCLAGETFSARHSTSHMSNVGLGDWSAPDVAAYERLAIARAQDIAALAALRAGLRTQVAASPLCDARRFGRHLGAALQGMWAGRPTSR